MIIMREVKIDPNEPVCIWVHTQGQRLRARARSGRDKRKDAGKTWLPVFVYIRAGDHYDCITQADDGISSCAHEIQFTVKYNAEHGTRTPHTWYIVI